jgi:hypothetical protein
MSGKITFPDRAQRIFVGLCLMILTILGLVEGSDWKGWLALSLQLELVMTGAVGWCPFYWACRSDSSATQRSDRAST